MKTDILFTTVFSLTFLALTGCGGRRQSAVPSPETVHGLQVITLQEETVPDRFVAVGTVHASRTAPLSSQIMGIITAVNVHEGDAVKRGQVLVAIDDAQARAAFEQANASLSAAEHELVAAESELSLAQTTFNRLQTLFEKKSLSPQEYDEARARLQSATARRDMARASRAQAMASLDQARTHLEYTKIHAPFDGVVTERRVDPGALAAPGMPLLTVEGEGQYRLEATVDESDLKFVRMGQVAAVSFDNSDDRPTLTGKVAQIVPAADPSSRSFIIKIDLPANKNLRSGIFGRAALARGMKKTVILPQSAVAEHGQLETVYVLGDNNVAMLRYVTLGSAQQNGREVLSGLSAGEAVVAAPGGRELAGKRIEVR